MSSAREEILAAVREAVRGAEPVAAPAPICADGWITAVGCTPGAMSAARSSERVSAAIASRGRGTMTAPARSYAAGSIPSASSAAPPALTNVW